MLKYLIKRLLLIIPTLIGVLFLVFAIMNLTPGNPGRQILGMSAKQETVDELNHELGYDRPFMVRFVSYIGDLLHGDMGTSYRTRKSFTTEFFTKVPVTMRLGVWAFIVSAIVGISLGILSAVKQYSLADTFSTVTAILFASIPGFFLGMVLIYVFSLKLGIFPTHGVTEWKGYVLPVITLGVGGSAQLMRLTRTTMLDAIRQDYMRTARAKGCSPANMIWKQALKNAILPVLTVLGTSFGSILGGAVICETVFAIPGLGNYVLTAIRNKDIPVVMSSTVFLSTFFCLVMVVVDILYAVIDPRIREKVTR